MQKAVLLDRDGVINKRAPEGEYITAWADFHILDGTVEALKLLKESGYLIFVVTNQRCVAKGLITESELIKLHHRMLGELEDSGAHIERVYYCPHDYHDNCECRKPRPGMLLNAAKENDLDLKRSWMIGDSRSDIEAGRRAGCITALVTGEIVKDCTAEFMCSSLMEAARIISQHDGI